MHGKGIVLMFVISLIGIPALQLEFPEETASTLGVPGSWHPWKQDATADIVPLRRYPCNPLLLGAVLACLLALLCGVGYTYT